MMSINRLLRSQKGQGMTEYLIIAILVALVVLFSINRFGGALRRRFGQATATVGSVQVTDVNQQNTAKDANDAAVAVNAKDAAANAQQ